MRRRGARLGILYHCDELVRIGENLLSPDIIGVRRGMGEVEKKGTGLLDGKARDVGQKGAGGRLRGLDALVPGSQPMGYLGSKRPVACFLTFSGFSCLYVNLICQNTRTGSCFASEQYKPAFN